LRHSHNSHIVFHDAKSQRRILGKSFAGEVGGQQAERIQWLSLRGDLPESIASQGDDGEPVSGGLTKGCERPSLQTVLRHAPTWRRFRKAE